MAALLQQDSERQDSNARASSRLIDSPLLIDYPALRPYRERYGEVLRGGGQPLRVVCQLADNSPVGGYDPVTLDGLLAWAVVAEATQGAMVPSDSRCYNEPLPLRCLWRSPEGLPLWAASCFFPLGDVAPGTLYLHKRVITGEWSRGNVKTGRLTLDTAKGRHMERRVPLPVKVCPLWEARAWGDPEEVLRLLASVAFVGKRRSAGLGEVREWFVGPCPEMHEPEDTVFWDGALRRPFPVGAAAMLPAVTTEPPSLVGWTVPHWKPSLFGPGWTPLTPITAPEQDA